MKDIEKIILPNHGVLTLDGDLVTATILDVEFDPFKCVFVSDTVEITTEGYEYLKLDKETLYQLIDLIEKNELYEEIDKDLK